LSGGANILPECKNVAVSVNYGNFEGDGAAAVSGVARLQGDLFFNGGLGFSSSATGGRAGLTFAW